MFHPRLLALFLLLLLGATACQTSPQDQPVAPVIMSPPLPGCDTIESAGAQDALPPEEEQTIRFELMSCESGEALARQDYAEGKVGYMITGERDDYSFDEALAQAGVKVYSKSCTVEPGFECYNKFMKPLILRKYGDDFFQKVADKAEIKRQGYDTEPAFPGGHDALAEWLNAHFERPATVPDSVSGEVKVYLVIGSSGNIMQAYARSNLPKELEAECIRVANSMPEWSPATLDGKPVQAEVRLPFIIKPD